MTDRNQAVALWLMTWLLVVGGQATLCLADDPDSSTYQPVHQHPRTGDSLTAPQPAAPLPSGVLGYQPIPQSALAVSGPAASPVPSQPVPGSFQRPQVPMTYDYTTWLVGEGPYTLGRDDAIHVDVRNQPDFSGDFIVGSDGHIQYNYLGDVPVAGMTKYEIQQVLAKLLQRYVRSPEVSVTIVGYNSKAVYVVGEVGRPGKYVMRGDTLKLREAIIAAGLPTRTAAMWRTHIIKPDLTDTAVRRVNLKKILYKGKMQDDVTLYPGEIVVVPSTVLSAVNNFLSQLLNPITRAGAAAAVGAGL